MQGCGGEEQKEKRFFRKKKEKENLRFLKQIKSHSLIYQFQLIIIFNNSSFNPVLNLSLSLTLWMKTQTHTHSTHSYLSYKSSKIHLLNNNHPCVHSHFINNTLNLSLKTIFLLSIIKINLFLPSLSHSSHSIQQCDSNNNIPSFISLIMNELSQVF